jgi:hypothetical protein
MRIAPRAKAQKVTRPAGESLLLQRAALVLEDLVLVDLVLVDLVLVDLVLEPLEPRQRPRGTS